MTIPPKMARVKYKKKSQNDMSKSSPTTCLAHLILCGSSAWALKYTSRHTPLALGTFSYLLGYSVVATYNYGHPDEAPKFGKVCDILGIIAEIAPFPMIASQIFVLSKVSPSYAYIPAVTALIPIFPHALSDEDKEPAADIICELVMAGNLIALMYTNFDEYESPWIWGLIALTTLNQFVFRRLADKFEVPKIDVIALGLSFFCIFAVNCLCDVIV